MGIKHFFIWYRNNFPKNIKNLKNGQKCDSINVNIDNLMVDLNGIFHTAAQKVYKYGNYKPQKRLLKFNQREKRLSPLKLQLKVFEEVTKEIEVLFTTCDPKKRMILCIDGPAPISKQNQQRQRRFRSAKEASEDCPFNSNCITPGTKFMDYLSKYIDWYIKGKINTDSKWRNIDIVFSNEKSPGEGEHKIINFIRYYGDISESYCICGLDADLIMLALATHMPKFYILREDLYDPRNRFLCLDIGRTRNDLVKMLKWKSTEHEFVPNYAINDFVFLCFTTGNDFLPHIPSIEIIEDGIDLILDVYRDVCSRKGHITLNINDKIKFQKIPLTELFSILGSYEKENYENKLNSKKSFFPNELLNKHSKQNSEGNWEVDIKKYNKNYCGKKLGLDIKKACHEYLEGMQWVLSYYTRGVPNWKWMYKYHYAPPASVLKDYIMTFNFPYYSKSVPSAPYQQLLSVLPPKSANLIPRPLCYLLTDKNSPLKKFCPEDFEIDLSGKRREWEGTVILPMMDLEIMRKNYFKLIQKVNPRDLKRNRLGDTFKYIFDPHYDYEFNSFYGNIKNCKVKKEKIIL